MKCVICHGQDIQMKKVNEEIQFNNNVIHVPIRIPVCSNCGERFYDRRTMKYLEEVEDKVKNKQAELKEIGKVLEYDGQQ